MKKMNPLMLSFLLMVLSLFVCSNSGFAQDTGQMVRMAKLVIDSSRLEEYKTALKEEIETSIRLEPGVITLYAVAEKSNPTHIIIFETYASEAAYKLHIQTPHFKKYKDGTLPMVKALELVELNAVLLGEKK